MKRFKLLILTMIIALTGFAFVGCGESENNFSLTFSKSEIEITTEDVDVSYRVKIENHSDYFNYYDINPESGARFFDFDFVDQIAKIDKITYLNSGVFEIVVNPLKAGQTTLTISLTQSKQNIVIPVTVIEKISGLSLKSGLNLYAVRGQSITFNQQMFKFEPEQTQQRDLIYIYDSKELTDGTLDATAAMSDLIQITAKSVSNPLIYTTFNVNILDEISLENISLKNDATGEAMTPFVEDEEASAEIVCNDEDLYLLAVSLYYDNADGYDYKLLSSSGGLFIDPQESLVSGIDKYTVQKEQKSKLTEDFLTVMVYREEFPAYFKEINYKINIKNRPKQVKINGQTEVELVNLFNVASKDNNKSALITLNPLDADYTEVYLKFYIGDPVAANEVTYDQVSDYMIIKQNGMQLITPPMGSKQIIEDISIPLEYYGINCVEDDKLIYIEVVCDSVYTEEGEISTFIPVKINKAATSFKVIDEYPDSTIYVQKGTTVTFDGFEILEEGAFVGNVYAYPTFASVGYVNISQTAYNMASIDIEALKVGEATYEIILSSGISTFLHVIVKEKISTEDFKVYIENVENLAIGEISYKENGLGSLENISIRGVNQKIEINTIINPLDADLFDLEISTENTTMIQVENNFITSLQLSHGRYATVNVVLTPKYIEDFQIKSEMPLHYDFTVECFEPIQFFNISAKNIGTNSRESNIVSVYNAQSVGYTDQDFSKIQILTQINPEESEYKDIEWSFSVKSTLTTDNDGVECYVLDYGDELGRFYPETKMFVCDGPNVDSIIGISFQIYATIRECGLVYTDTVQVVIEEYVMVDRVWLYNYIEEVYLDAVHQEETLFPYILPTNANNKNISVWFEPDAGYSNSIVQLSYDSTQIKLKYTGLGYGMGTLHIVPTAKFQDSLGTTNYSFNIRVRVADGSKANPLQISTMEELIAIDTKIGLTKHYIINTLIDASGYEFETMGEFSGSITGYNITYNEDGEAISGKNTGGIVNLKLSKPYNGSLGLFSSLTKEAELTNLTLSGRFDYKGQVENIGFVAGVNYGLIKNVNVTLYNSSVTLDGTQNTNVGIVVGTNHGAVACDIRDAYSKEYQTSDGSKIGGGVYNYVPETTLFAYMPELEQFEITIVTPNIMNNYYIGGIIGQNEATLQFDFEDGFKAYNYYGTSAAANIKSSGFTAAGGAVGLNNKTVKNIVTSGEISANNNVGGLIGILRLGEVDGCSSRTFVRGNEYVAGLIGLFEEGKLSNSSVIATDDTIRTGEDASLIKVTTDKALAIYAEIYNSKHDVSAKVNNVSAVSYITRTYQAYDHTKENEVKNNSLLYYGEIFITDSTKKEGKQFVDKATTLKIFEQIENSVTVMMYYQAVDASKQMYIQSYNYQDLPEDVFKTGYNPAIIIQSLSTSIVGVDANGKIKLFGTGLAKLRIYNAYNKRDYFDISVYIINAVDKIELYNTSDYYGEPIGDNYNIAVTNREPVILYPKYVASSIEAGHMIIDLVENTNIKLKIDYIDNKTSDDSEEFIKIAISGKSLVLSGQTILENGTPKFTIKAYFEATEHYALDPEGKVTSEKQRWYLTDSGFSQEEPGVAEDIYNVTYTRGIYEIGLDKTSLTVIPSDVIKFTLSYKTDSTDDEIIFKMHDETNGITIIPSQSPEAQAMFDKYFTLTCSEVYHKNGDTTTYYVDYTLKMKDDNLQKGIFNFKFETYSGKISKTLRINYLEQPITSVIVKNYSFVQNNNIELGSIDNNVVYNTSYTMQESDQVTAGETNLLRLYIAPVYASYAYVDISNNQENYNSSAVAQFSLLKKGSFVIDEETQNGAVVSTEGYYNSNGIRVLSSSITDGDLIFVYKIPTNIAEGTVVKIDINFYNQDGTLAYETITKELTVVLNKHVYLSIADKEAEVAADGTLFYRVARGYSYKLKVNKVGYSDNEVTVITSSPYASITKRDGEYFLQIAEDVSYGSATGEGLRVLIEAYGSKMIDGKLVKSQSKYVECTIVEYAIDVLNIKAMFEETILGINVGNTVDIRQLIMDNLDIEYAPCASDSVSRFKNELINKASWWYKLSKEVDFKELDSNVRVEYSQEPGGEDESKYVRIQGFSVTPLVILEEVPYSFGLSAELSYNRGYIDVKPQETISEESEEYDLSLIQEFTIETHQNTTEEHPWPIYTYEDLLDMSENGYYILMNDIAIPSSFEPIKTAIKSFDGNGHSLIFNNVYAYSDTNAFGIFKEIYEGSIVKNVTIYIESSSRFIIDNSTSEQALNFGLLTSVNNGMIYNAVIKSTDSASISLTFDSSNTASDSSIVAGLCAVNNGYITNSRANIKIETTGVNLAGFVGNNTKHIASCYMSKSYVRNLSTNVNNTTGGFVLSNTGNIYGSYISGDVKDSFLLRMYSDNMSYIVKSSSIAGAFAFNNDGIIEDCYANIPIVSSTQNSGFVAINGGEIKRAYTTSILGNNDTDNYPFFIQNSGNIEDCIYLSDGGNQINVNISVTNNNEKGLMKLTLKEFALQEKEIEQGGEKIKINPFENYVANGLSKKGTNTDINTGVWFFPEDPNLSKPSIYTFSHYVSYDQFKYKGEKLSFIARRPELVSANLLAYANQEINEALTQINPDTGETIYSYMTTSAYATPGSILNPNVIKNVKEFETTVLANPSQHYRLVCDLDYVKEGVVLSGLYKTTFTGYLDGNSLKIANYSINSGEVLASTGYFSQIGNGTNFATVKNLTLCPKYINLPNSFNVGSLAGMVNRAYVYNVAVDGYANTSSSNGGLIILGRDIVGGVIGRTVSAFEITNVTSSVSANSTYIYVGEDLQTKEVQQQILYNETHGNAYTVSYSGAIIGYVGGTGTVTNPKLVDNVVSIGMISGLFFGGIGMHATVRDFEVQITDTINTFVRASVYGGAIAGDSRGTMKNIIINQQIEDGKSGEFFKEVPRVPLAIGGVVGYVRGGLIEDVSSDMPVKSNKVFIVGGLAGMLTGATMKNCSLVADNSLSKSSKSGEAIVYVQGVEKVGGLVGHVDLGSYDRFGNYSAPVRIDNCSIGNEKQYLSVRVYKTASQTPNDASKEYINEIYVGGIIGFVTVDLSLAETLVTNATAALTIEDPIMYVNVEASGSIFGDTVVETDKINFKDKLTIYCAGVIGGVATPSAAAYNNAEHFTKNAIFINVKNENINLGLSVAFDILKDFSLVDNEGKDIVTDGYYLIMMSALNNNKTTTSPLTNVSVKYLKIEGSNQSINYSDFSNGTYSIENSQS